MTIQLDEHYRIEDEAACWILHCKIPTGKTSPTTGEPTFSLETSYHANFKQALIKYLDESLKGCESLQQVLSRITDVEQRIEALNK